MKSYMQKKETVERSWYVIDAEGESLGRVATKAAHILRNIKLLILHILIVAIM